MNLNHCVYILKCVDGKFYTGYSARLDLRIKEHTRGEVSFTKSRLPISLVYVSYFATKEKAYQFEKYLKSGSGIAFRNKRLID